MSETTNSIEPIRKQIATRHRTGTIGSLFFRFAIAFALIALVTLLGDTINKSMGYAVYSYENPPGELAAQFGATTLNELSTTQLTQLIEENVSTGRLRALENEMPLSERSQSDLVDVVIRDVVKPSVDATFTAFESLFRQEQVFTTAAQKYPGQYIEWRYWVNADFITNTTSSNPYYAGIRTAILGSIWVTVIAFTVAIPLGIGAALYLEEYANHERAVNRFIQTNINNLAGVPSIIYGILGLAVFVRVLEPFTSGAFFGAIDADTTANGRTILSAGMTLGLLILPLIIINSQEAVRAVPQALREASYGLGATKWQTIWHHVLPNAVGGIFTGTILSVSRAFGETAPLIVVGASTFITTDPTGPFSKFTTLT
ncbi:MAG: phosphate ABC transporter permease PstA, partial [Anaerolineales bacterium]|nr:phosphate ABC transporter permease PstA [Anaerolineales bacterium]